MQAISRRRKIVFSAFHSNQDSRPSQDHALAWPLGSQVCTKNSKVLLAYVVLCEVCTKNSGLYKKFKDFTGQCGSL